MDTNEVASLEDLYADKPTSSKPTQQEQPAEATDGGLTQEQAIDVAATGDTFREQAKEAEAQPKAPTKAKAAKDADDDDDLPSDVVGLRAALKDTRRKARERKLELDARVPAIEAKLAAKEREAAELDAAARQLWGQLQQYHPQNQRPEPPDPLLDPAGAVAHERAQMVEALRERDAKYDYALYMARVVPSQRMMREKHADYEEMEAVFAEAAKAQPHLWQQIRQQEFPAEFAYQVGKEMKQRQEIAAAGSFDKWLEQKVAEKVAAATPPAPQVPTVPTNGLAPKAPPPQSLARVPSVTPRTASKAYQGPTPLTDLYK